MDSTRASLGGWARVLGPALHLNARERPRAQREKGRRHEEQTAKSVATPICERPMSAPRSPSTP